MLFVQDLPIHLLSTAFPFLQPFLFYIFNNSDW